MLDFLERIVAKLPGSRGFWLGLGFFMVVLTLIRWLFNLVDLVMEKGLSDDNKTKVSGLRNAVKFGGKWTPGLSWGAPSYSGGMHDPAYSAGMWDAFKAQAGYYGKMASDKAKGLAQQAYDATADIIQKGELDKYGRKATAALNVIGKDSDEKMKFFTDTSAEAAGLALTLGEGVVAGAGGVSAGLTEDAKERVKYCALNPEKCGEFKGTSVGSRAADQGMSLGRKLRDTAGKMKEQWDATSAPEYSGPECVSVGRLEDVF